MTGQAGVKRVSTRAFRMYMALIVLTLSFAVTAAAVVMLSVSVDDNLFQTGEIAINVNDGEAVIGEGEFIFEPGMTVTRTFFVKNEGTEPAYFKIYLENVEGDLKDVVELCISDTDTGSGLASGTAAEITEEQSELASDPLDGGETRTLTLTLYYPEDAGNETEEKALSFDIGIYAVQTKNNSGREQ